MAQQLHPRQQRSADSACVWLCLLPYFGFFALLFMGKKSRHAEFTKWGIFYAVIGTVLYAAGMLTECLYYLANIFREAQTVLSNIRYNLQLYLPLAAAVLWLAVVVHTLIFLRSYRLYMTAEADLAPADTVSSRSTAWKNRNSVWMLWSFLPFYGCFSTWYAGSKLNRKGMVRLAIGSLAATVLLAACHEIISQMPNYYYSSLVSTIQSHTSRFFYIVHLILAFSMRRDYLAFRAAQLQTDVKAYPHMGEAPWCRLAGRWRIWTFFPCLGGIGLCLAGRRAKSKRIFWIGMGVTLSFVLLMLGINYTYEVRYDYSYLDRKLWMGLSDAMSTLLWWLYLTALFYGTLIRWDVLREHAKNLQGFYSEADREIALRRRSQSRPAQPQAPSLPRSAKPGPQSIPQTAPVDLNRCSLTELTALPGVGVAEARRAVEHRTAHGGFSSVDEFIDLLGIKPHFAVQIFAIATAESEAAPAAPKAAPNSRAFDL